VRYEAPAFGVGELWLEEDRVLWSELPRPSEPRPSERSRATSLFGAFGPSGSDPGHVLAGRLQAFFAGGADDFADVELDFDDGFYGDCQRALRAVPRGDVVTYGELAALAGRPGAARAAGTFCARNRLAPFVPCHRVVAADGIGGYGTLGLDYKRRLLALEHVVL
jgi:methylated-DNA-[protein]-cysteine S-methyltransferase